MMEFRYKINTDGEIKTSLEINDKLCSREFHLGGVPLRVARCGDANKTRYEISGVSVETVLREEATEENICNPTHKRSTLPFHTGITKTVSTLYTVESQVLGKCVCVVSAQ